MAQDKETREIEIIANGQKFNSSIKEMGAAVSLMGNQLRKMAADDPNRAKLNQDFLEMKQRLDAANLEMRGLVQTEEQLAEAQRKLHQENMQAVKDGQSVTASLNEMKAAAAILEKQLADMGQYHPDREQMIKDFQQLKQRIGETKNEIEVYKKTEKELAEEQERLHQENVQIIADGKKISASYDEMRQSASAMEKQLHSMSANDPGREKLKKDFLDLKTRINGVKEELSGAQKVGGLFKQAWGQALGVFTGMGLIEVAQQLWGVFTSSQKAFQESAQINAQLESSLESTGHAAGITKAEIEKLAEVRMGKTLFDDDATKGAASLLLTFTNIKKGVFEEAIPAIQDMAQKMAGDGPADLKGASIQVGKALNDPIKGITALSKVGVSFTEEQKATIKTMVAMGDTAGAQKLILGELNKEFGGSAEAARKAGGGWATLKMQAGELQESLGGLVQGGLDRLGNFLTLVMDKSEPLVAVFQELWTGITDVYDSISDIISSLGIFNSESSIAEGIVSALSFAFTVLATPLKVTVALISGLIEGFTYLYNRSELVRGTLGGLGATAVAIFTSIKNAATNVLGGVADLLVGIFTLDVNKIKSGLKKSFTGVVSDLGGIGVSAGEAFMDGYAGAQDKRIVLNKNKAKTQAEEEKALAAQKGEEVATAETEAQKKAREKAEKEAEKARLQREKELEKARDEFNAADAKAEEELARLKVEIMEEGIDKVLAKLRLQHDLEKVELEKQKQAVLENAAATVIEKNALVDSLNEQQRLKDEELRLAEEEAIKADEEKKKAEEQRKLEEKLAKRDEEMALKAEQMENDFLNDQTVLDDQFGRALEAEYQRDEALRELRRATAAAKLADLEAAGQGETLAAVKLKNEIAKVENEKTTTLKKNAQMRIDAERNLTALRLQLGQEAVDGILGMLNEESTAYQLFKNIKKVLATVEIGINLQRELQANAAAAAANPLNAVPGGSAIVAAELKVKNIMSGVRSGLALASVAKFEKGGLTGGSGESARIRMEEINGSWQMASGQTGGSVGTFADGGWVNDAQLGLIGERGRELVIPNWMVTSPKYANTVGWLESERIKGVRAFADGGMTAAPSPENGVPVSSGIEELQPLLLQQVAVLEEMRDLVELWPTRLQVHNNVGETNDGINTLNGLRSMANA